MLQFPNLFQTIFTSGLNFLFEFVIFIAPPYSFLLQKIKEPPDGIIRIIVDCLFILGHFLYLLLFYIYLSINYHYNTFSIQDTFFSIYHLTTLILHHLIKLPVYGIQIFILILRSTYNVITQLYKKCHSSSHGTLFDSNGTHLNFHSATFRNLSSCAFAARAAGSDAISFDADSFDIAMDNCASKTMTFCKEDFITPIGEADVHSITGAGGNAMVKGMGDVEYFVVDDDGVGHSIIIKDALYVPDVPFRLMAVNQFAKQVEGREGSEGTGIFSFGWHSKFKWQGQKYCKTIVHRENIDIPVMEVNCGNKTYSNFYKSFTAIFDDSPNCSAAFHTIPSSEPIAPILPDDDRIDIEQEPEYSKLCFDLSKHKEIPVTISPLVADLSDSTSISDSVPSTEDIPIHKQSQLYENQQKMTATFSLQDFANATFSSLSSEQQELLSWHNRLGHLPFTDLNYLLCKYTYNMVCTNTLNFIVHSLRILQVRDSS